MEDRKLAGLKLANHYWQKSYSDLVGSMQKLEMAKELHEYGMFSLSQIAKIVRLQVVALTREGMTRNATGGRFEPETLTTLIAMRQSRLLGERVPVRLIEICTKGGTSWSCAATLTGVSYSNYYKNVPKEMAAEVRQLRLKPRDKDAIHKAMNAKADAALLGEQYGVSTSYIQEIHRAYGNV